MPAASVQRSHSLKPQALRPHPPSESPSNLIPDYHASDKAKQHAYDMPDNRPIDRVRADDTEMGASPRVRTGSDPNVRVKNARQVGDWQLGKTIGAGSMGKVKTATNVYTGEKVSRAFDISKGWVDLIRGLPSPFLLCRVVCGQNHPSILYTLCSQAHKRRYSGSWYGTRKGGRSRPIKGDPDDPRSVNFATLASPLHLRDEGDDCPCQPLLHGVRVHRRRSDARLHHQPRTVAGTSGKKVCQTDSKCSQLLSPQFYRSSR